MILEAEQYADEDREARERIGARNSLENYIFTIKNQIKDQEGLGGKIETDDKKQVRIPTDERNERLLIAADNRHDGGNL